jgi:glycerophosphoryl diester phosphodiesterase
MRLATRLVAHRGEMHDCPENTRAALRHAISRGARYVEFDIQLTRDHVPVVFHDEPLLRTTGQAGLITEFSAAEASAISAHEPARLGERFTGERIPTLSQFVALLNATPEVTAFVELKRQSIERFGVRICLEALADALRGASFDWVLISFEHEAVTLGREQLSRPIGWVLREYDDTSRVAAEALAPEYLFCDWHQLPDSAEALWPGRWKWVIYDVEDAELAQALLRRGASLIETGRIDHLIDETSQP